MDVGHLEDEALKRREKVKALKRKREGHDPTENNSNKEAAPLPKPSFRSYKPSHEKLQEFVADLAKPGDVTSEVAKQLESVKSEPVIDQLDVTSLAPRKPDWDLKRDVAKKLAKLERQTQKAIAELIRIRLKEMNSTGDLAEMVNAGATNSGL
ncbi:unnamed protein product [Phaedon cochleariae]|uniref:Coiled-coil domain-containing protein 12 n=1 Tax=Phaedon cochleariae TaxID=80249 RepID=A0A9N9SAI3_PHACE|nr:unnamed protein product [Phaedon cochleariae]